MITRRVIVEVVETNRYEFPQYPDAKCSAHGSNLCLLCCRNPASCATTNGQCEMYLATGMHWDTCANRIR